MKVRTIRSIDDFLNVRAQYVQAMSAGTGETPFYTFRWLEGCWRCLGDSGCARMFCLFSDDDELKVVVPLKFQANRRFGIGVTVGSLLGIHLAPFTMPVNGIPGGWEQSLVKWLHSNELPKWAVLTLGPFTENSAAGETMVRFLKDRGLSFESREFRYHRFPLEGSWDAFLRSQSKHFRRTLHVKERDAFVKGPLMARRVSNPSAEVLMETVFRVAERSWQGRQESAVASTEKGRRFYEHLGGGEGEFDVDLSLICDGDKCVSYLLGIVINRTYYAFDTGFDPDYARYSLGYLVLWSTLRALFDEGIQVFDHGIDHPYKQRYDFQCYDTSALVLFRNRGVAAAWKLWKLMSSRMGKRGPS